MKIETMSSPVEPILASSIHIFQQQAQEQKESSVRLQTGSRAIDNILDGGLEHGQIHGITTQHQGGADSLVQTLIKQHLLSAQQEISRVAVIGSTVASLDVQRLHASLQHALASRNGARPENKEDSQSTGVLQMLDNVCIMKVFDFEGLSEAIAELRESLEGSENITSNTTDSLDQSDPLNLTNPEPKFATIATIDDSDAEPDLENDEGMLDQPEIEAAMRPTPQFAEARDIPQATVHVLGSETTTTSRPTSGLLIIDGLSHIVAPLLKNNYVKGQAATGSFMRMLQHLTRMHGLCSVVLGHNVGSGANTGRDKHEGRGGAEPSLSSFEACTVRPALGEGWGHFLDTHIFIHSMPYSLAGGGQAGKKKNLVEVLEIVQDRFGGRLGRWRPFTSDDLGDLKDIK